MQLNQKVDTTPVYSRILRQTRSQITQGFFFKQVNGKNEKINKINRLDPFSVKTSFLHEKPIHPPLNPNSDPIFLQKENEKSISKQSIIQ